MSDANLSIKISADNQASHGLQQVEESSRGLGESLHNMMEIAGGVGLERLGEGIAEHISEGITAVQSLGKATLELSRNTGMSTETSSAWLETFKKFGVESDAANKSLGIFEKNLANGTSKVFQNSIAELGLQTRDADGNLRSMNDLLLDTADAFKNMPDGPEKTALAMNMFGRAGKDLLPVLDQGRDGLQEAMDTAAKYGLTLSGDNVQAVKNFGLAHKEMDAAIEGVSVQLGVALMPLMTDLIHVLLEGAAAFNENFMPAIHQFGDFLANNVVPVIEQFGNVIKRIIGGDVDASFTEVFGEGGVGQMLDEFCAVVIRVVDAVKQALDGDLLGAFKSIGENVLPILMDLGTNIQTQLTTWAEEFIDWIAPMIDPMLHNLGQMATDVIGWMVDTALPQFLSALIKWGVAFVEWVAPHIPPLLLELGKLLLEINVWIITTALPAIIGHIAKWSLAFLEWVANDVVPMIPPTFQAMIDAIGTWLSGTAIPWAESKMGELATSMVTALGNGFSALGSTLNTKLTEAFNSIHIDAGPFHLSSAGFRIDTPSLPSVDLGSVFNGGQTATGTGQRGPVPTGVGTMAQSTSNGQLTPYMSAGEIMAFCGPIAAEAVASSFGKQVDISTLKADALKAGWTGGAGMGGTGAFQRLMDMLGIDMSFSSVAAARSSTSAVFSTPNHYFESTGYDANTDKFHVGNSGTVFRGGSEWMSLAQITALGGGLNGILTPSSQRGGDAASGYGSDGPGVNITVTGNTMLSDSFSTLRQLAQLLQPELARLVGGPA